jgi:tetratricopeptide (TPR) repeat protein
MLTRSLMLTIKKRGQIFGVILSAGLLVLLTGCAPPGQRALLKGARLIEEGKFNDAVPKLEEATTLLAEEPPAVQAQAWNHLGLALHQVGQPVRAIEAYQRALKLDRNLAVANYNLGCVQLEQQNFPGAIDSLTTYVSLRPKEPDGFVKLGHAQHQLAAHGSNAEKTRQLDNARKSFESAQRLNSTAEVWNALGMIQLQRTRGLSSEAIRNFKAALQQQSDYAPALLNLAVVYHQTVNDHRLALQKYRDYLALQPRPANSKEVEAVVRDLDLELNPRPVAATVAPPSKPALSSAPIAPSKPAPAPVLPSKPEIYVAKAAPASSLAKPTPTNNSPAKTPSKPVAVTPPPALQVVTVQEEAPIRSAQEVVVAAPVAKPKTAAPPPKVILAPVAVSKPPVEEPAKKPGVLQRLNPVGWFSKKNKTAPTTTLSTPTVIATPIVAPTPATSSRSPSDVTPAEVTVTPKAAPAARYHYTSPAKGSEGDRSAATKLSSQGSKAQRSQHLSQALEAYRGAVKADPSYFDAWFALGLTASEAGELTSSLGAFEQALAITPESADARYAFAWSLQKANYFADAANELEKLLAQSPNEVRGHLLLANLCSQKLDRPQVARDHYLKVLEADPRNSQATAIRYWIKANP